MSQFEGLVTFPGSSNHLWPVAPVLGSIGFKGSEQGPGVSVCARPGACWLYTASQLFHGPRPQAHASSWDHGFCSCCSLPGAFTIGGYGADSRGQKFCLVSCQLPAWMRGPTLLSFLVCSWEALPLSEPNYIQSIFKQWACLVRLPGWESIFWVRRFRKFPFESGEKACPHPQPHDAEEGGARIHSGRRWLGSGFWAERRASAEFRLSFHFFHFKRVCLEASGAWKDTLPFSGVSCSHPQCCPPLPKHRSGVLSLESCVQLLALSLGSAAARGYSCWGVHCSPAQSISMAWLCLPPVAQEPSCTHLLGLP